MTTIVSEREPVAGELCSCGEPAVTVLITDTKGEKPWCGALDVDPAS